LTWVVPFVVLSAGFAAAQEPQIARGAALLVPFKVGLQEALRSGLAKGPVEAIGACRVEAPSIAEGLSRDGIRLGRSSDRLRNPANVAPEWVRPILDAYLEEADDRAPRTVAVSEGRAGYVEPILLQPLCLTCHGASLAPEVAVRIDALYPEDRAVGFEVGDLRGVFWVEYPLGE